MHVEEGETGAKRLTCQRSGPGGVEQAEDCVVMEEPLELRIGGAPCATIMRTPGSDRSLALGFYFTEGWISGQADIGALAFGSSSASGGARRLSSAGEVSLPRQKYRTLSDDNVVDLIPAEGALLRSPDASALRLGPLVSSCGVCGKRTIEEVFALSPRHQPGLQALESRQHATFSRAVLLAAPEQLRRGQRLFRSTGALHGAGIFDVSGRMLVVEEDVGRHNAVDKVVGWAFLRGLLPLEGHGLVVSGRVSFEIVQKAYRAGVDLIAAVSGVSSLAVDLAGEAGIALCGFVRGEGFTIYSHSVRLGF